MSSRLRYHPRELAWRWLGVNRGPNRDGATTTPHDKLGQLVGRSFGNLHASKRIGRPMMPHSSGLALTRPPLVLVRLRLTRWHPRPGACVQIPVVSKSACPPRAWTVAIGTPALARVDRFQWRRWVKPHRRGPVRLR